LADTYDIAVVGSGFAGSLMAMIARRLGYSVVLIEQGKHPRIVIGESSTPLTNLLLEELALRYDLPALKPLTKWGSWQRTYPEIACGLKRGFTFYHQDLADPAYTPPNRTRQLLVAASPNDAIADTHWYRADFDHLLVRMAQEIEVEYLDEVEVTRLTEEANHITLDCRRGHSAFTLSARFLIDATGPRGFLHRILGLSEQDLPGFPHTQAIYNHFAGVKRLEDTPFGANDELPPYPIDDAAVHHVFDGGWAWVLRFNNGIVSAGIAATDETAADLNFNGKEQAWDRLLQKVPALQEQFADAQPIQPFRHIPRLSFSASSITGPRWAMLPSAAGFVDPLLSTGFPLTLLGVARLGEILADMHDPKQMAVRLKNYAAETREDLFAAGCLIGALYANMGDFRVFTALSMLYFAAVSYTETARRLGKAELAPGFLLRKQPIFAASMEGILRNAMLRRTTAGSTQLIDRILEAIEPFDVAGLCNLRHRNWYPVNPEDLFQAASKLDATREEIATMLTQCQMLGDQTSGELNYTPAMGLQSL
jgi:FADH2 O2-dependent halogenase